MLSGIYFNSYLMNQNYMKRNFFNEFSIVSLSSLDNDEINSTSSIPRTFKERLENFFITRGYTVTSHQLRNQIILQ